MEMNPFYLDTNTIWNRLSRVHKGKSISEADVVEWSAECINEYIEDYEYFVRYDNITIEATVVGKQKRFYLPCLVYRLLDVLSTTGKRVNYVKDAGFIRTVNNHDSIIINYIGIPVNDQGMILVDVNHAKAVQAFIVKKLYYEDFLNGKVHINTWQTIEGEFIGELEASKGSFRHWDQSAFETISAIKGNMVPEIARLPLYKGYNTAQE